MTHGAMRPAFGPHGYSCVAASVTQDTASVTAARSAFQKSTPGAKHHAAYAALTTSGCLPASIISPTVMLPLRTTRALSSVCVALNAMPAADTQKWEGREHHEETRAVNQHTHRGRALPPVQSRRKLVSTSSLRTRRPTLERVRLMLIQPTPQTPNCCGAMRHQLGRLLLAPPLQQRKTERQDVQRRGHNQQRGQA